MNEANEKFDIVIAEDQVLLRIGLKMTLEQSGRFTVREAANGEEAIERCREMAPHLVLMDIQMPVMDGISATQAIRSAYPETKILMLTTFSQDDDVFAAFGAGADGYCLKDIGTEQLQRAILSVIEGAKWLDPAIADRVLKAPAPRTQAPQSKVQKDDSPFGLTAREREVLQLIVQGLSNQQVADALVISNETVKTHVRHILEKLVVSDRTQAAVKAMREGLV